MNNYTNNSSKGVVLEVDFEYPKELRELHNGYPLDPDKIEIKIEVVFNYQMRLLIFTIFLFIPIENVKKLLPNFFNKEKYLLHYENLELYLLYVLIMSRTRFRANLHSIFA